MSAVFCPEKDKVHMKSEFSLRVYVFEGKI